MFKNVSTLDTGSAEQLFRAKQQRCEVQEVVAPDEPGVLAGGFDGGDGEAFGFGPGGEIAVRLHECVAGPAGYPEEFQAGFLRGIGAGERGQMLVEVSFVDCGAEAGDVGELVGVIEADVEAFEAAHGEAGNGVVVAAMRDVVLALDGGHDLSFERL